jgi:hypothetical protein
MGFGAAPTACEWNASDALETVQIEQRHSLVNPLEQILDPGIALLFAQGFVAGRAIAFTIVELIGCRQKWASIRCKVRRADKDICVRFQRPPAPAGKHQGHFRARLAGVVHDTQ